MAYKDTSMEWTGDGAKEIFGDGFFNLTMAVGGYEHGSNFPAPNLIPDMQLIFYMSFIIYRDGDKNIFPTGPNDRFSTTPSQINYYSDETKAGLTSMILRFQTDLINRGQRIYKDGRCDPVYRQISSISGTLYTTLMYNSYYELTVKTAYGRSDWQEYLVTDPLLPEDVRFELTGRINPYSYM